MNSNFAKIVLWVNVGWTAILTWQLFETTKLIGAVVNSVEFMSQVLYLVSKKVTG